MPLDLLAGLVVFAVVTCFTPGPNNTMLMSSGINFGFARSVPHVLGVTLGFAFMVLAVGVGIGRLFAALPGLYDALRVLAVAYLLWLAWGIATAGGVVAGKGGARPMSFLEACAFQWVNPKGWIMALGAATGFAGGGGQLGASLVCAAVFAAAGFASSLSWALFGTGVRRLLTSARLLRVVNVALALLLVASLYPVVRDLAEAITPR